MPIQKTNVNLIMSSGSNIPEYGADFLFSNKKSSKKSVFELSLLSLEAPP